MKLFIAVTNYLMQSDYSNSYDKRTVNTSLNYANLIDMSTDLIILGFKQSVGQ